MADPYDSIFQQDMERNTVPENTDTFWSSLWSRTRAGLKEGFASAGSGGLMYKPASLHQPSVPAAPYAKQYDAKSGRAPAPADYENFLTLWESRMSKFTRNNRFVQNTLKD